MAEEVNAKLVQVADLVNLAKKNDTLYPRKDAVTAEINEKISAQLGSVYTPAGSIDDLDGLPTLKEENVGKVVNLTAEATTTENFVEGAGKDIAEGSNIAVVETAEGEYKYDVLSGFVDLTPYAKASAVAEGLEGKVDKLEGMGLSSNDYTTADRDKLASLNVASPAEVQAVINGALGITNGSEDEDEVGA